MSLLGEAKQRLVDHVWHVVDEHVWADQQTVERSRTRPLSAVAHLREAQPGRRDSANDPGQCVGNKKRKKKKKQK